MLKSKLAVFLILASLFCYGNDDYDALWTALNKNDRQGAKVLAEKAKRNSSKALDAYLTQLFLQTFEGKEDLIEGFIDQVRATGQDKSAYLYALWFNGAVLGQYGKKAKKHQFDLLNTLISDNTYNGSIRAAAHYVKALHHIFGNDFEKSKIEYKEIGGLANWQLVGPFENISGTGFYKQFGPESSPHATTKFVGSEDIEISWFTPAKMNNEGWMFTQSHIKQSTAIIYAQTFVYAPQDVDVLLNAGGSGSLKVWLNDGLIISESTPRVTELDYYKNRCTLKKGYNRVLVQLGYTENSSPNYIVRFTDINFNTIKGLSTTAEYQPYAKINDAVSSTPIKHFAEEFFEKKIEADPKNLINYLLLSQTYLRSLRTTEARRIIEKALQFAPENSLLRFELIQCLLKAQNRTLMLQEVERLRETDPECTVIYQIKLNELMQEEKYQQAEELLNKIIQFNGEDEDAIERRIKLLAKLNKLDELVKTIETAYKRYPEYPAFAELMFRLKKQGMNDSKGAINIYERYFKTAYNYELLVQLAQEYSAQGQTDKYLSILKSLHDRVGHDPRYSIELCDFYLKKQHYEKALDYVKEALQLSPYEGSYWNKMALVQEQMNKTAEAIDNYRKTIYYDKTNYEAQKKLLSLEKKIDLTSSLPQNDVYEMIRRAPTSNSEYDFTYLLDEKAVIVYDKGASEEFITYAVKIYDQEGIDTWKEHYLSYDSNVQNILVEKCETVKANGSKVPAERDDNHVVFTNLEPGDAVYIKYRLQNYTYGRLGKELWDKFIFNAFVPANVSRYTLIAPSNLELRHETINGTIKPVVQQIQNYKLYTWEMRNVEPVKSEPLMPSLSDAGVVLHVSTVKSWRDIANWYSDISYQDNANDFELNSLYSELFKDKKHMTDVEIARSIYQYIQKNIRYSSVSFRQSGLTPQPVAKTISTRLGDCKDLSSLFVALAEKAGVPAKLVLVSTRDNGIKSMVLPAMEFNHCIVLAKLGGKDCYLEMTDNHLPFGALPNNLIGALTLVVPRQTSNEQVELTPLSSATRIPDASIKRIEVQVENNDLKFSVDAKRLGGITSEWRSEYANMSNDDMRKKLEKSISGSYKNAVKLLDIKFSGLNTLDDSVLLKYHYTAKNEVIDAGSMKMIRVPFLDIIASVDNFSADERTFPIEYWRYENTDVYENIVTVKLAPGQKLIEVPKDISLSFNKSSYKVKYTRIGEQLKIHRYAKLERSDIKPDDYDGLRKFFTAIVEAETKYIVFK